MAETTTFEETEYRRVDQTGETYYDGKGLICTSCKHVFKKEEALGFDYCPHCGKEIIEEKITYGNLSLVDKKEVLCILRRITYGLIQYGDIWETYNKALLIIEHDIKTEEERIKKINEFLDSLNEDEKGSLLLSVLIDTLNYINKGE